MKLEKLGFGYEVATPFQLAHVNRLGEGSGVYVLCTIYNDVLYIGQSKDVARRLRDHLNSRRMTAPTRIGRARTAVISWLPERDLLEVEKRLLFVHKSSEGNWPELNRTGPV